MLFLDQDFSLFRMVHFTFPLSRVLFGSDMLKMEVECKISFLYFHVQDIRLRPKTSAPLERT